MIEGVARPAHRPADAIGKDVGGAFGLIGQGELADLPQAGLASGRRSTSLSRTALNSPLAASSGKASASLSTVSIRAAASRGPASRANTSR
jgi:hypothetical protein